MLLLLPKYSGSGSKVGGQVQSALIFNALVLLLTKTPTAAAIKATSKAAATKAGSSAYQSTGNYVVGDGARRAGATDYMENYYGPQGVTDVAGISAATAAAYANYADDNAAGAQEDKSLPQSMLQQLHSATMNGFVPTTVTAAGQHYAVAARAANEDAGIAAYVATPQVKYHYQRLAEMLKKTKEPSDDPYTPERTSFAEEGNAFAVTANHLPSGNHFYESNDNSDDFDDNSYNVNGNSYAAEGNSYAPEGNSYTPDSNSFTAKSHFNAYKNYFQPEAFGTQTNEHFRSLAMPEFTQQPRPPLKVPQQTKKAQREAVLYDSNQYLRNFYENLSTESYNREQPGQAQSEQQATAQSQQQLNFADHEGNSIKHTIEAKSLESTADTDNANAQSELYYTPYGAEEPYAHIGHDQLQVNADTKHLLLQLQQQLHHQQAQFALLQQQMLQHEHNHHSAPAPPPHATTTPHIALPPITTTVRHTKESAAAVAGIPLSKHTHITRHVPVPHYQQLQVPYSHNVTIPIPQPVITTVPRPVPIQIPVQKTITVPKLKDVKIPIEKLKPFPVERPVPFIVERRVPYTVEKQVATPMYYRLPIKVPIIKTVVHKLPPRTYHPALSHLFGGNHLG